MADYIKLAGASALAALLLATPALADFHEEWDGDGDVALSEEEFNTGVYGGYDEDESGVIEEPELGDVGDVIGDGGLFDI